MGPRSLYRRVYYVSSDGVPHGKEIMTDARCGILHTLFGAAKNDAHGCVYKENQVEGHPYDDDPRYVRRGPIHCYLAEDERWIEWWSECADYDTGGVCPDIDECEDTCYEHVVAPRWEYVSRCDVPDCDEIQVYTGLCMKHADDECGDPNPTVEDLVGPL